MKYIEERFLIFTALAIVCACFGMFAGGLAGFMAFGPAAAIVEVLYHIDFTA